MRDINDYSLKYIDESNQFEKIQVHFRRKKVLERLAMHPHKRILEVGCATDSLANYVDDFDAFTIVEPSKEFTNLVTPKIKEDKRITIINDYFEEFRSREEVSGNYDFIIVSGLLHEIPDLNKFMSVLSECCNPETVVHINVPNANSLHRVLAFKSGIIPDISAVSENQIKFQISRIFNQDSLRRLVEEYEFKVLECGGYFLKPFTHAQMAKMLTHGIITEQILNGFYRMIDILPDYGSEIFVDIRLTPRQK